MNAYIHEHLELTDRDDHTWCLDPVLVSRSFISTLDIHPPGSPDQKQRARFDRGKLIFIDPAPTFDGESLMQLASYLVRASALSAFDGG